MTMPPAPGSVTCEPAGPVYATVLEALHADCFPKGPSWRARDFGGLLSQAGCICLLARIDDEPAGFALMQCAGAEADLALIAVSRAYRRRGIGRKLMEALLARMPGGVEDFFLDVAEDNEGALAFYRSVGFAEVGRRKGYYRSGGGMQPGALETGRTDAILMKRTA